MAPRTTSNAHAANLTQRTQRVDSDIPSRRCPSEQLSILPSPSPTLTTSEIRSRLLEIGQQEERLRVEKKQLLERLKSIVYPILTLPPEITSEIFIHCVRGHNNLRGPLLVATVCKAWRAIALTTPAIWSEFHGPWFGGGGSLANMLQCWLPRAGSRPLTLKAIHLGEFSHEAILETIAPYSSQWTSLDLNAGFRPVVFPVGAIHTPLLSLKTLQIQVHQWPIGDPTSITAFVDAPQLREIHLVRMSLSQISLPWIQITHLTLSYQSLPQIFEILQQTPNLEDLTVSLDDRQIVQISPFTLPHLRHVKLSSARILDYLILPALHSLELMRVRAADRASVQSLVQRSECVVRALHLSMTDMQETCECLGDIPSLHDITIQYPDWSTADFTLFFDWLSESEPRTVLPALEMLYIDGATENVEVGVIAAFLSARRTSVDRRPNFKLFKLLFSYRHCDFQVEEALEKLIDLRTGGLQIDVTQAHKWAIPCIDSKMVKLISGEVANESIDG
ncbi:hypothetical protein C8J57DRAFT_1134179 [Mycena rebaudengoi]|nr:hypothetical protein C8J57DRAFT_1134179 [Mycena rebaudengoi]